MRLGIEKFAGLVRLITNYRLFSLGGLDMATEIAKVADVDSTQPIGREIQIAQFMIIIGYVSLVLSLFVWIITFQINNPADLLFLTFIGANFFAIMLFLETMGYFLHRTMKGKRSGIYENAFLTTCLEFYYYICCIVIVWNALKITGVTPTSPLPLYIYLLFLLTVLFFPVIIAKASARWKRLQTWYLKSIKEVRGEEVS